MVSIFEVQCLINEMERQPEFDCLSIDCSKTESDDSF